MFSRERRRVTFDCGSEVLTEQAHKDACDINNILRTYRRTGMINHLNPGTAQYGDLPDHLDYQEALELVRGAGDAFSSLPAAVRERYGNDAGRFLSAVADPAEAAFLREQGLLAPLPATPEPATSEAVPASSQAS